MAYLNQIADAIRNRISTYTPRRDPNIRFSALDRDVASKADRSFTFAFTDIIPGNNYGPPDSAFGNVVVYYNHKEDSIKMSNAIAADAEEIMDRLTYALNDLWLEEYNAVPTLQSIELSKGAFTITMLITWG